MKPVEFLPDAQIELLESAQYYEDQQIDLGKRFLEHVQKAVRHIQLNPLIYGQIEGRLRKCRVDSFPYGVVSEIKTLILR